MNITRNSQMRRARKRPSRIQSATTYESLESRQLLASVGWDGPGQGSAELTYYIGQAPAGMSQAQFESTIEQALKVWSDVVDVKFTQTNQAGLSDSLDFTSRPIDGQGGTLARAYFPDDVNPRRIAGDVEFDSNDSWEVGNARGGRAFDLLYVAVHEIGHALGIEHIHSHSAVLAPSVHANQTFDGLSQHDIDAAMEIYAPAKATQPTEPPTTDNPTQPPADPKPPEGSTPDSPSQPPNTPNPQPDTEVPQNETPGEKPQPDSQLPDTTDKPTKHNHDHDDDHDHENELDPSAGEPDNAENPSEEPSFNFRFEQFLNFLFRRVRFIFWSPIRLFFFR